MIILKKIITPFLSLFLAYRTIELVKNLSHSKPEQFAFFESFIISFLLTLFITGVFAIVGFAYPTHKLLPNAYYKINNPQQLNRTFKLLGINYFRTLLLLFFWGWKKNRKKYFDGTRSGLENFVYQSKQSEFGHLISAAAILIISFYVLIKGFSLIFILINVINVLGNVYPVILQRHHRIRIDKILSLQ